MSNLRQFFLLICLLIIFSCQKKVEQTESVNVKIFAKQPVSKIVSDSMLWISAVPSDNEVIFYFFQKKIFVRYILINRINGVDYCKVDKFIVYTDKGKFVSQTDSILLNDSVLYVIFRFETDKYNLNFYNENQEFVIANNHLSKPFALQGIDFYGAYGKINLNVLNIPVCKSDTSFLKLCDYTHRVKSFEIGDNYAAYFVEGKADTVGFILHFRGKIQKVTKFIYDGKSVVYRRDSIVVRQTDTYYSLGGLRFYVDFPNYYFVNVKQLDTNFVLDIKYATENNFMNQAVYPCAKCLLRYGVAKDLVAAQSDFMKLGFRIKLFDCYRPLSVQRLMWKVYPNASYVANPDKGSIHNRGSAVDLTLVDSCGRELDMGSDYDFFGYEAHSDARGLSEKVMRNRQILQSIMKKHHFGGIRTEWWHFHHIPCMIYSLSDQKLSCGD